MCVENHRNRRSPEQCERECVSACLIIVVVLIFMTALSTILGNYERHQALITNKENNDKFMNTALTSLKRISGTFKQPINITMSHVTDHYEIRIYFNGEWFGMDIFHFLAETKVYLCDQIYYCWTDGSCTISDTKKCT
jgi:hypothetical protein